MSCKFRLLYIKKKQRKLNYIKISLHKASCNYIFMSCNDYFFPYMKTLVLIAFFFQESVFMNNFFNYIFYKAILKLHSLWRVNIIKFFYELIFNQCNLITSFTCCTVQIRKDVFLINKISTIFVPIIYDKNYFKYYQFAFFTKVVRYI